MELGPLPRELLLDNAAWWQRLAASDYERAQEYKGATDAFARQSFAFWTEQARAASSNARRDLFKALECGE